MKLNYLASEGFPSIGDEAGAQFLAVREALAGLGEFAQIEVSSGILIPWGEALDWPGWIFEGTSLDPSSPLPARVSIADDYIIISHFLDRYGPRALLKSLMTDSLVYFNINGLQSYSTAPNALAWLRYFAKASNIQNPSYRVAIVEVRGGIELRIASLAEIGKLSAFCEHVGALMVNRVMALFQPMLVRVEEGRKHSPKIRLRGASAQVVETVSRLGEIDVESGDEDTSIFVPTPILRRANPNYDPEIWKGLFAQLKMKWLEDSSPFSISSLRLHIRQSLKQSRRAPNIDDFASDLAISKRTLGRKMASLDISFRDLVREERMTLALQMLKEQNRPVGEVAHCLGYGNTATFSRAFRNQFGQSPSDWLQQNS